MRLARVVALSSAAALVAVAVRDRRGLRRRASTDALTGLPNRAEFERRARATVARAVRDGAGSCLVVVDLDRFKLVNDSAGHAGGDRVLIEVAARLRAAVRDHDLVARWGGDEFVLLLGGVADPRTARARAAAIADSVRGIALAGASGLTASVGTAIAPADGRDLASLLRVADLAMYDAKPALVRMSR